ncbi:uncharacterized protein LOC107630270 [Arachis ipaensis]|uniref:Uncharacterized protein n=1 Tax=Arachis hypogaea TaxID=3818 RepID=A0A445ASS9_ARAHY|nr:uncharacterized protein LOC107630270 [Arachis ipaensis]XP_025628066.1 uncharacterized protein LOC112721213 [Arachis hypogaea]RYR29470.1 hypothetical protein Ahy_B01g053868 [Arachis hypogaea]
MRRELSLRECGSNRIMEAVPALENARDMIDEIENRSSHLLTALESGQLSPGGIIIEGSASSTAISITMVAPAFACKSHVIIPNDATIENIALGATVERVRPVSITHKDH